MPVAYSRGRRSGGYVNWLTCQWHVNGSSEPLAKNSPTDDDADGCIAGNYYGYERGGTLGGVEKLHLHDTAAIFPPDCVSETLT